MRTNTLVGPGSDAAVVRVKGTRRALAMSVDGNGRYCWLDPYEGARLAVAEACRNVAAGGGLPIGATNCLNFANPERPEVMGQFVAARGPRYWPTCSRRAPSSLVLSEKKEATRGSGRASISRWTTPRA